MLCKSGTIELEIGNRRCKEKNNRGSERCCVKYKYIKRFWCEIKKDAERSGKWRHRPKMLTSQKKHKKHMETRSTQHMCKLTGGLEKKNDKIYGVQCSNSALEMAVWWPGLVRWKRL